MYRNQKCLFQIYGFDYDYTLAVYTRQLNDLIYKLALDRLVNHYYVSSPETVGAEEERVTVSP